MNEAAALLRSVDCVAGPVDIDCHHFRPRCFRRNERGEVNDAIYVARCRDQGLPIANVTQDVCGERARGTALKAGHTIAASDKRIGDRSSEKTRATGDENVHRPAKNAETDNASTSRLIFD